MLPQLIWHFLAFPFIDPEVPARMRHSLMNSLVYGMNEDLFWETFVQCLVCKAIMLRMGIFTSHRCWDGSDRGRLSASHPYATRRTGAPGEPSNSRSRTTRVHLVRSQADIPQVRPLRAMQVRSSSPDPTDVFSDSDVKSGSDDDFDEATEETE